MRVFSQADFDYLFPAIRTLYDYEGFLEAIAKYPAFCGEQGPMLPESDYDLDDTCARELSVMFSHFV
jgi:hypothetical protein